MSFLSSKSRRASYSRAKFLPLIPHNTAIPWKKLVCGIIYVESVFKFLVPFLYIIRGQGEKEVFVVIFFLWWLDYYLLNVRNESGWFSATESSRTMMMSSAFLKFGTAPRFSSGINSCWTRGNKCCLAFLNGHCGTWGIVSDQETMTDYFGHRCWLSQGRPIEIMKSETKSGNFGQWNSPSVPPRFTLSLHVCEI